MMTITNPLKQFSLFATPESFDQLQDMIENECGIGTSESAAAMRAMMYTQNLCAKLFDDSISNAINADPLNVAC